jgi:PPOX class probable F420-dependent enzyme
MAIESKETLHFIQSHRVARLATADAQGRPAVVPVCYVLENGAFYSSIDEKPKRVEGMRLRRVRNILENPNVSLVIDDYSENWSELRHLIVYGTAVILDADDVEQGAAIEALRRKYEQYRSMSIEGNPVIKIVPTRLRFWSAEIPSPSSRG